MLVLGAIFASEGAVRIKVTAFTGAFNTDAKLANAFHPAQFVMAQSGAERRTRRWVKSYSTPAEFKRFLAVQRGPQ